MKLRAAPLPDDAPPPDRIVLRPDGYHWIARDVHQEFGPYPTLESAMEAMDAASDFTPPDHQTLLEVEDEIGIDVMPDLDDLDDLSGRA